VTSVALHHELAVPAGARMRARRRDSGRDWTSFGAPTSPTSSAPMSAA
jgi:hypothetical protein